MAQLGDTSSLLELGFTFNIAAPALFTATRQARSRALEPILEELRRGDAGIALTRSRAAYFDRMIPKFYPGLRHLTRASHALIAASVVLAAVSFIALVVGATAPTSSLDEVFVWAYAVVALVALPLAYWGLISAFGWIQEQLASRMGESPDERRATAELFKILVLANDAFEASNAKMDELTRRMEALQARSAKGRRAAEASIREMDRLIQEAGGMVPPNSGAARTDGL